MLMTPTEIEIKYDCLTRVTAEDVEAVPLGPFRLGERTDHDLHDILLDTPSRAFSERRVALRLRFDGDRRIVTMKGPKAVHGNTVRREEYEATLGPEAQSDSPSTWPEPFRSRITEWRAGEPLFPFLTVRNQRLSWPVTFDGLRVAEIVLDTGQIEAGGLTEPFHEIEIEMKEGMPEEVEMIAGLLLAALPLRHATVGKAERGFALLARAQREAAARE
ncbi:MAG: CYTH domain-containing protein [Anaerolineales bacterium]|nr:CYTH domain-containing protein [Anaerolineales bacterium]MCB9128286.1 CYTH domain-containing protein [Ardenticatenales bacterium]MCB9172077.1 CYTH domain-containing protein [Ardenticatenales bacterium]